MLLKNRNSLQCFMRADPRKVCGRAISTIENNLQSLKLSIHQTLEHPTLSLLILWKTVMGKIICKKIL